SLDGIVGVAALRERRHNVVEQLLDHPDHASLMAWEMPVTLLASDVRGVERFGIGELRQECGTDILNDVESARLEQSRKHVGERQCGKSADMRRIVDNDVELAAGNLSTLVEGGRVVLAALNEVDALVRREVFRLLADVEPDDGGVRKVLRP